MKKHLSFHAAAILLISMFVWFTACQKESAVTEPEFTNQAADDRAQGDSKVFPPTAHPYGKSYAEWSEVWLQELYKYHCDDIPWVHPESVLFYQSGPVYILAGIAEVGGTANITVPHGKALLFPLVNAWWDMCPGEEPGPGQTVEEYLLEQTANLLASGQITNLRVEVDGSSVSNVASYKFYSDVFEIEGTEELAGCYDPCVTGDPQPAAMAGYYILLKPLSKGTHTVHYHMEAPGWGTNPLVQQDGTYNITVQ